MKNRISKELLNEVLPYAGIMSCLISYGETPDGDILLQYSDIDEIISIHKVVNECKNWALNEGYILKSSKLEYFADCEIRMINNNDYEPCPYMTDKNEQDAIIKACQWILEVKTI